MSQQVWLRLPLNKQYTPVFRSFPSLNRVFFSFSHRYRRLLLNCQYNRSWLETRCCAFWNVNSIYVPTTLVFHPPKTQSHPCSVCPSAPLTCFWNFGVFLTCCGLPLQTVLISWWQLPQWDLKGALCHLNRYEVRAVSSGYTGQSRGQEEMSVISKNVWIPHLFGACWKFYTVAHDVEDTKAELTYYVMSQWERKFWKTISPSVRPYLSHVCLVCTALLHHLYELTEGDGLVG